MLLTTLAFAQGMANIMDNLDYQIVGILVVMLCLGGLAVILASQLEQDQPLKVGLLLGNEKIISRALVRHVLQRNQQYTCGMKFIDLGGASKSYLTSMYATKVFKHSR